MTFYLKLSKLAQGHCPLAYFVSLMSDKEEYNLDGIQVIRIFDASVWISLDVIYLDELIHICKNVDGCLGKRGYGNTPVCAKPSYWMYLGRSEFSLEFMWNMRPMVNRFVLDKCRLRTNYDVWFLMFSGRLHVARSLQ